MSKPDAPSNTGQDDTGPRVLETSRLILEQLTVDDAQFMLEVLNEPSFLANIGDRGVRTVEEAEQYILDGPVDSYARFGFGMYLTRLKTDRTPIGLCGLVNRDTLEDVDIGFAFKPQFWGQGFAYESSVAVVTYAREAVGLKRLLGIVSADNAGSIRVLEKVGLSFVKMITFEADSEPIRLYATDL